MVSIYFWFAFSCHTIIIAAGAIRHLEIPTMETTSQRPSKLRIVLMWLLAVGMIMFWVVFWVWRTHNQQPADTPPEGVRGSMARAVVSLFFGGFFLCAGLAGYLVAVFTACLTLSYRQPVWKSVKVKMYFANIIVTILLGLGLGFLVSVPISPILTALGFDQGLAFMLPVMLMVGLVQIIQLWLLIWSPMERQVIVKRLVALGITPAQWQSAAFVGLSNPASGFTKRFGAIEEDLGALWVGPQQLVYWGDGEQFGITREQVTQIERRADNRSTSVLGGIAHVILHVRLPDGNIRQIRLHTEAHWTMGRKRRAMDALAEAINRWHDGAS
jgi:hypothetical protein